MASVYIIFSNYSHLIYSRWPCKEVFCMAETKSELKKIFLSINLSKFGTNFPYILPGSLPIMTQLPSFLLSLLPSSLFLPLFLPSSSAPNILTGHLNERDLCWRWGCSPRWLSESSQGLGTSRETLAGGHGQMGTTGQHREEGGKLGQVAHAGGGSTTPTVFTHRTQAAPSTRGPSFLLWSPKGRGISHPFFHPGCLDSRTVMSPQGPVGSWSGAKRERRTFQAEWASQRPCSWGSDLTGSFSAFQNFTFSIYLAVGHLENSLGIFLNGLHNADSCHLPLPWGPTFILITQSVLLLSTDSPPRPQTYPGSFSTDLFLPSPTCCLQFLLTL